MLQPRTKRRPVTPERLEAMGKLGGEAGRMFQRHSSGAGGVIRALAEDLLDLLAVYEEAERERAFAKSRLDAVVRAVAGVGVSDAAG